MQISAENLTFTYSKKSKSLAVKAIDGVTLTISEGEFFGIIGRTGSGKSTFVQHLNGLIKVQKKSGKLLVGEFDLTQKKCKYKELRKRVGMVFQYPEYQLFAETVKDDVAFGLKNFYPEKTDEERENLVKEAIEITGLNYEEIKDKSPFELSGGQRRRVAIAGVIVTRPEVLVLDEPVAGLDPQGKRDFLSLLHSLKKDFVKTLIVVTHDMDLVSENCTSVAVFSDGKLIKTGVPKEIFEDKKVEEELALPLTSYLIKELEKVGVKLDAGLKVDEFCDTVLGHFATKSEGTV